MKPGAYVCIIQHHPTLDHDQSLLITSSDDPTHSQSIVGYVKRYDIVFVLSEKEVTYFTDYIKWWFVKIMTLDFKVGWVVFCFGENKSSYFEHYEREMHEGQSKNHP